MKSAIVMYLPVLHQGYLKFFREYLDVRTLFILGRSITNQYRPLVKDIRALKPEDAHSMVISLNLFERVEVVEEGNISKKLSGFNGVIMPNEDVCRQAHEKYLYGMSVEFVNTFLRWTSDSAKAHKEVASAREIIVDGEIATIFQQLLVEAEDSVDQYRQVGAAVCKPGEFCICSHNRIVPSIYTLFYEGDPRSQFQKGINIEMSLALHGEAGLVARAAKEGLCLDGADMFVTDFPCPPCAKQIAYSGIRRLFYLRGYAILDGERILLENGVEIYKVKCA